MRSPVLWESVLLSLLCVVDAFWTVLMCRQGLAKEANPIMAFFLAQSVAAFVAFKLASFLPGILAVEYLKFQNRKFATFAVRFGAIAYLALYVVGDLRVNHLL